MSRYIPSKDTLWEFSAPGYCDFSVPYTPLPDDGYFDPCLLENADGFDLYPAPPTPQAPLAPNTPASHSSSSITAPLSISRSAARRIATPKALIDIATNDQATLQTNEVSLRTSTSLEDAVKTAQQPLPASSLLREEDYADLKSPVRPVKGAWLQHVMTIAQNSASSSAVDAAPVASVVESTTTVDTAVESNTLSSDIESTTSDIAIEVSGVETLPEITKSPSLQIANVMGTPRSPRVQVTAVLSAASSFFETISELAVVQETSESVVIEEEVNIRPIIPSSTLGSAEISTSSSLMPVQFSFSPQLVSAVEEDSKAFFQKTSESVAPLASLDVAVDVNPNNLPPTLIQSENSVTSLITSSIPSSDAAPSKSNVSTQFLKNRVQTSSSQQLQKKASVPITSKASAVVVPPPINLSTTTSSISMKKPVTGTVATSITKGPTSSSSSTTSASSALAAFKQRTAALAAKVFASANAANVNSQESRAPPSGVAQFIASTSPVKKSAPVSKTAQANVNEQPLPPAPAVTTVLTGQAGGARRVPKAEPASLSSTMPAAGVPPPAAVSAPLPGAGFIPNQPSTNFVPTALLLAKYESGVRDLVIPVITAGGAKANVNAANKKTDVQPFTFATAGRANRRRSADASLAPAAIAAAVAMSTEGSTFTHKASSDAQQRTMSALAVKRSVARVPTALHDSAIPPSTLPSTSNHIESSTVTVSHPIIPAAPPPPPPPPPSAPPSLLVPHKLGEIPDAVKRAARIAQEERSAAEATSAAASHTAAPILVAESSSSSSAAAGGGAQGRLERFHGLLNKMGRSLAVAAAPVVSTSSSSSLAATSKENIHNAVKTRPPALPTVAKSPLLHTKRRTLERAQNQ
jgi:hypothetical protein